MIFIAYIIGFMLAFALGVNEYAHEKKNVSPSERKNLQMWMVCVLALFSWISVFFLLKRQSDRLIDEI